jgi:transcriptional regulator with XRE-family HTH domain
VSDIETDLIEQVRQRMKEKEITQDALGKMVFGPDAGRQYVSPYLTGKRRLLSETGIKILEALGVKKLTAEWD